MTEQEIDVIELETLERGIGALDDVLARQSALVDALMCVSRVCVVRRVRRACCFSDAINQRSIAHTRHGEAEDGTGTAPEDLGGDDELGAGHVEALEHLAHADLGLAGAVHLRVVEEVAASVQRSLGTLVLKHTHRRAQGHAYVEEC